MTESEYVPPSNEVKEEGRSRMLDLLEQKGRQLASKDPENAEETEEKDQEPDKQ